MFCGKCGNQIDENSEFCNYCGASITVKQTAEVTGSNDVQPSKSQYELQVEQLTFEVEHGSVESMKKLGDVLYRGETKDEKNIDAAFPYWEEAAKRGDATARYLIGTCYRSGFGIEKNDLIAETYFRAAASQNHGQSQYAYSLYLERRQDKDFLYWLVSAHVNGVKVASEHLEKICNSRNIHSMVNHMIDEVYLNNMRGTSKTNYNYPHSKLCVSPVQQSSTYYVHEIRKENKVQMNGLLLGCMISAACMMLLRCVFYFVPVYKMPIIVEIWGENVLSGVKEASIFDMYASVDMEFFAVVSAFLLVAAVIYIFIETAYIGKKHTSLIFPYVAGNISIFISGVPIALSIMTFSSYEVDEFDVLFGFTPMGWLGIFVMIVSDIVISVAFWQAKKNNEIMESKDVL